MLAAIGFVCKSSRDRNDERWMKNWEEAWSFYEENGHFPRSKENDRLYQWSMAWWTRTYLKNPEANEEKAQMLRDIGFEHKTKIDINYTRWYPNYLKCQNFVNEYGRFPSYKDNEKLIRWLYRWYKETYLKNPVLHQEKLDLLIEIGFKYKGKK